MQAHLGSDALKALGEEVRHAHPGLQCTEGMFDGPSSDAHAIGCLIQPRLHHLKLLLVRPTAHSPVVAGGALALDGASWAR